MTNTKQIKKFKVEIFEYKTGKTTVIIGRGLSKEKAEKRERIGLSRCNNDYGCRIIAERIKTK